MKRQETSIRILHCFYVLCHSLGVPQNFGLYHPLSSYIHVGLKVLFAAFEKTDMSRSRRLEVTQMLSTVECFYSGEADKFGNGQHSNHRPVVASQLNQLRHDVGQRYRAMAYAPDEHTPAKPEPARSNSPKSASDRSYSIYRSSPKHFYNRMRLNAKEI